MVDRTPGTSPERDTVEARPREVRVLRSRTGATWFGIGVVIVATILLIVFMLQNNQPVLLSFLGWQGTAPLSVALLIAGVGVGVVMLIVGSLRMGQLRRRLSRLTPRRDAEPQQGSHS